MMKNLTVLSALSLLKLEKELNLESVSITAASMCSNILFGSIVLVYLRDCLREHILRCTDADVKCPCNVNDDVTCKGSITELEMKAVCVMWIVLLHAWLTFFYNKELAADIGNTPVS